MVKTLAERDKGFQTVDEYREWQKSQIDKAALMIGLALAALPKEFADAHQNAEVGGNLHNALGALLGVKMTLGADKDAVIVKNLENKNL